MAKPEMSALTLAVLRSFSDFSSTLRWAGGMRAFLCRARVPRERSELELCRPPHFALAAFGCAHLVAVRMLIPQPSRIVQRTLDKA